MYKVPSPFNSPFAKVVLPILWVAYVGMLIAYIVGRDPALLFFVIAWTIGIPWISWNFLSGVQVRPGKSVGGGPMYSSALLEPGEQILFNAPAIAGSTQGHLFVTEKQLIVIGIRLLGGGRKSIPIHDISQVDLKVGNVRKGIGLLLGPPRLAIRVESGGRNVDVKPWPAGAPPGLEPFMGNVPPDIFINRTLESLGAAGAPVVVPLPAIT